MDTATDPDLPAVAICRHENMTLCVFRVLNTEAFNMVTLTLLWLAIFGGIIVACFYLFELL